ncbi:MAG: ATP-binding protein [Pseudonocardiales bacterium]|nr:ATP-binding protein [Pseudonocardiales bacterium]
MTAPRATLADRVRAARHRAFVGRASEQELFRQAVEGPGEPPFTVLHVHGPGGIGKSALLRVLGDHARAAGVGTVLVDGRTVAAEPAVISGLVAPALAGGRRAVLLFDTYEAFAPLDGWVREELLPGLPGDWVVVLSGRHPPGPAWTADPGWRELSRILPLAPLTPAESADLLAGAPLTDAERRHVLAAAAGHPLVLVLARELAGSGDVTDLLATPEVVGRLVARLVDRVPSPRHERALYLCARARATTVGLLRDVLGDDDAGALFEWLRAQSYVEADDHGLHTHDVVRDVLLRDLEWRDEATAREVLQSYQVDVIRRVRGGVGEVRDRAVLDAVYDTRHNPASRRYYDWDTLGSGSGRPAGPGDRDGVAAVLARQLPAAEADAILRWFDAAPERAIVYHRDDAVQGLVLRVRLDDAPADALRADPVAAAAWQWAGGLGLRPGQRVVLQRCGLDRDAAEGPSPAFNIACQTAIGEVLTLPDLAVDMIVVHEPDRVGSYFESIGYPCVGRVRRGGRTVALHACDWRSTVPDGWWDVLPSRPGAGNGTGAAKADVDAVRAALRDLTRPDRLAAHPLSDGRGAEELRTALLAAIDGLRAHPRDLKLHRALDRTYVHPAATQELAAEVLGLPFSTYRRHLTQGIARVAAVLADRK